MPESYLQLNFTETKLANGWKVMLSTQDYPLEAWIDALSDIGALLADPIEIFRDHGNSTVMRKDINIAGKTVSVIVKHEKSSNNLRTWLRTLRPAKSFRFLKTVSELEAQHIPTVKPLAAMQKNIGVSATESILITEYTQQSEDLYWFMRKHHPSFSIKKAMSAQIAQILANMHKGGLWHRDAKAQNFLVTPLAKDDSVKLSLLDLDGIKGYGIRMGKSRYRPLAKLAATLLSFGDINKTDYLRTFRIYCKLTGIDTKIGNRIFRRLTKQAIAIRLLTMARAATNSLEKKQT
jgi:serine/threonine protein kinase